MNPLSPALRGAILYEFRMATRRKVLWIALLPLLAIATLICVTSTRINEVEAVSGKAGAWAVLVNIFIGVGLGVGLADRFVRTHRFGLAEVLAATPTGLGARMFGVLCGSVAAGLVPVAAVLVVVMPLSLRQPSAIPAGMFWGLVALLIAILPAVLLITMISATAGLVMPVPLARVLAVLLWFWSTIFSAGIIPLPTPTGTLLSPLGDYIAAGWLQGPIIWAGRGGPDLLSPPVTALTATLNLIVILTLTAVLFGVARATAARRS